jgi:multimeric flavodoxin WrbA
MKALIISSSYRRKGNTFRLTNLLSQSLAAAAKQAGISLDIDTIDLADMKLSYCQGCRVCFDKGETFCPLWDEIAPVKAAMQAADVWILASPVYVDDVNGVMKTFLERMAHVNHRPEFAGKYAYLVTTSGTGSSGHAARTMANTLRTWGVSIIGQKDFISGALSTPDQLAARYEKTVATIAGQILKAFCEEKALRPSLVSFIFFTVQQKLWQRHSDDSIDYKYWESKGWLKPGVTYFFPHKSSPLVVIPGRLAGSIIARFFE